MLGILNIRILLKSRCVALAVILKAQRPMPITRPNAGHAKSLVQPTVTNLSCSPYRLPPRPP